MCYTRHTVPSSSSFCVRNDLRHSAAVNFSTAVETLLLLSLNPTALYLGLYFPACNVNMIMYWKGLERRIRDLILMYDPCFGVE
jgi:hypothetical protein